MSLLLLLKAEFFANNALKHIILYQTSGFKGKVQWNLISHFERGVFSCSVKQTLVPSLFFCFLPRSHSVLSSCLSLSFPKTNIPTTRRKTPSGCACISSLPLAKRVTYTRLLIFNSISQLWSESTCTRCEKSSTRTCINSYLLVSGLWRLEVRNTREVDIYRQRIWNNMCWLWVWTLLTPPSSSLLLATFKQASRWLLLLLTFVNGLGPWEQLWLLKETLAYGKRK